jgi:hypothetical protein
MSQATIDQTVRLFWNPGSGKWIQFTDNREAVFAPGEDDDTCFHVPPGWDEIGPGAQWDEISAHKELRCPLREGDWDKVTIVSVSDPKELTADAESGVSKPNDLVGIRVVVIGVKDSLVESAVKIKLNALGATVIPPAEIETATLIIGELGATIPKITRAIPVVHVTERQVVLESHLSGIRVLIMFPCRLSQAEFCHILREAISEA